jgi:hypothetical protein
MTTRQPTDIQAIGGLAAILTGIFALLYSVAFVIIARTDAGLGGLLSALFLMLTGLATIPLFVALYSLLQDTDANIALWALLVGVAGALGAAVHGGYDLANAINPPGQALAALQDLPHQFDPRALLTFGFAGLGTFIIAWLIVSGGQLPRGIGYLGYVFAVLLLILYLARLIVLDSASPVIVIPAILTGFIISPVWNIWLGLTLWQKR